MEQQLRAVQEQAHQEVRHLQDKLATQKQLHIDLEKQYTVVQSEHEKDKALYEDKLNFITLQKTRLEADKLECEKRLKEEQDNLQRAKNIEKERASRSRKECVSHLESHYNQLTQRMQEDSRREKEETSARLTNLQEQNQDLTTQVEILKRERDSVKRTSEERQSKSDKVETQLRQEIASLSKAHSA